MGILGKILQGRGVCRLLSLGRYTCSGKLGLALSQPNPWDSHLALVIGLQATRQPRGLLILSH